MQKNTIVIALVALVIGLGIGYGVSASKAPSTVTQNTNTHHVMPDGSTMGNDMNMAEMMASMNAELEGKTGDDFDKAFINEMIMHHQGAVEMAQAALKNAKHQEIKDLANAIISAQNKEIADMRAWQKSWYGIETNN